MFCAAGINIGRAQLLQNCFRIRLHVVIRIGCVTYFLCLGESSEEPSCMVPGMVHVSSFPKLFLTLNSSELSLSGSRWPLSKIGVSYSDSHALAYRSSCFVMTSGSGFQNCAVVYRLGVGFLGENERSLVR